MIEIRTAQPDDLAQIGQLWNQIIRDTDITFTSTEKSAADLQAYLSDHRAAGDPVLVGFDAGSFAGFGSYHPFRSGDGYSTSRELTISLVPEFRHAGHGAAFLHALENHARQSAVHCLIAGITATNTPSRRFFAKHGYVDKGLLPEIARKFDRWHDLVLMQKIL